jgi:amino-acid N-acetyltransferase
LDNNAYVSWFRHSSPYIHAHRGKTFVVTLPGETIAHAHFSAIVHDIALLSSLGARIVIVAGSRPQIEARLALRKLTSSFHNGLRVTDLATLECVIDAAAAQRALIEAQLSLGLPNSPMFNAQVRVVSGNFVTAKPLGVIDGVDFQHTGNVRRIDTAAITQLLDRGHIVLLGNLGYSSTGEIFNLSTEEVALQAALALKANKLIIFGAQAGVIDGNGELVRELQLNEADALLTRQTPAGLSALRALVVACEQGVERGHLISHETDGALLLELFTRDGCGSLVTRMRFESIRQARIDDVAGILDLLAPLEADGTLVKRSRELLETEIGFFHVIDRDGGVVACAALYEYTSEAMAEVACVVTHNDYRGSDRAQQLLDFLEAKARDARIRTLFVLTTRTAHWFQEQGFVAAGVDQLPAQKQHLYNYQRNSKVFIKRL